MQVLPESREVEAKIQQRQGKYTVQIQSSPNEVSYDDDIDNQGLAQNP